MTEDDFNFDNWEEEENYEELDFSKPYFSLDDYMLSNPDFSDLNFDDQANYDEPPELVLDVPYVPTDENVVRLMLEIAKVGANDVVYDLGCGDGRIVVAAAMERGARGVGVDLDSARIADAMEYAIESRVENKVQFIESDLRDIDITEASVVALYLLDHMNEEIKPRLLSQLKPGTRVISHAFEMGGWKPDVKKRYGVANIFMWIIPAQITPNLEWTMKNGDHCRAELKQKYQKVTGKVWINNEPAILRGALLRGNLLELVVQKNKQTKAEDKLFDFSEL